VWGGRIRGGKLKCSGSRGFCLVPEIWVSRLKFWLLQKNRGGLGGGGKEWGDRGKMGGGECCVQGPPRRTNWKLGKRKKKPGVVKTEKKPGN